MREIVVAVLRRDGMAFALAHNHPSGDPTPSTADIEATSHVAQAAAALDLRFLGHVVVTDTGWRSVLPPQEHRVTIGTRRLWAHRDSHAEVRRPAPD